MTLTLDTINELLPGAKPEAIVRAVKHDGLPGRKVGRRWYFDADAVRTWLARQEEQRRHEANVRAVRVARAQTKLVLERGMGIDHFGNNEE